MIPYQREEEGSRLRQQLSKDAVDLAIQGRWKEAEMVNRDIIERFPADVEAYNRLGRALTELSDFAQAREAYLKAVELAPSNTIAKKNLARLASLPEAVTPPGGEGQENLSSVIQSRRVAPELFTAEMGKAGMVNLCNVASCEVLAKISLGGQVQLRIEGQRLIVESESGEYLGEAEPKYALRLIKLMKGGNKYAAAILSVRDNEIRTMVKEVYQHPSQVGYISFPVRVTDRARFHLGEGLVRHRLAAEEGETMEGNDYSEEQAEYSKDEGESLPEGFSVIGENNEKGELQA